MNICWNKLYLPNWVVISDPCYTRNWTEYGCVEIENMKPWNYNIWIIYKNDYNEEYWLFHESLKEKDLKKENLKKVDIAWADAWVFWFFDLTIFPKNKWKYSDAFFDRCCYGDWFLFHFIDKKWNDWYKGYVINSWDCSVWIKWIKDKKWQYVALNITYA